MTLLSKNGLVDAAHGKGGGYRLNRKLEDYKVGEVLTLTEGSLSPVACLINGAEPCPKAATCRTLPMWTRLDNLVTDYLNSVSLADLIEAQGACPFYIYFFFCGSLCFRESVCSSGT